MKKIVLFIAICAITARCKAQNSFGETINNAVNQGSAQIKMLIQQIAALQVYIGYLEKGYSIAKDGLNLISDIKHGDLNLHTDYFNSLKTVNPAIKRYVRVADIITLQLDIVQNSKDCFKMVSQSGRFTASEITYIHNTYTKLMDNCAATIDELITLTTSGNYEMKDDERIKRIDALYADMQDKYMFSRHFSRQAKILATQRTSDEQDVNTMQTWYNLKKN